MRSIKIVADSSANMTALEGVDFACAPLKIITAEREFVDDTALDVAEMVGYFDHYKGRSQTSCPNPLDWLDCFGEAEDVICVTITSGLSGSYNAACIAKQLYESEHPQRRVHVVDSLSAGPELELIIHQLAQWIQEGRDFDRICQDIAGYQKKTGLVFMLESLKNFAANGRISPAVAKLTGILGIRIVGQASTQGQLEPLHKCRGENKSLSTIVSHLAQFANPKGKVCIAHCRNEAGAAKLKQLMLEHLPGLQVAITVCRGLCSYYAELGGILVGFEKA